MERVLSRYLHLESVLPAMGYPEGQIDGLEETIRNAAPDAAVSGTPHDRSWLIDVDVPIVRVRYELEEKDLALEAVLERHADALGL